MRICVSASASAVDVAALDEEPVHAVLDEVRDAADPGRHDAAPAGERLEDHPAEPLGARGQDEARRRVHPLRDALGRQLLDVLDAPGIVVPKTVDDVPERAAADEHEARVRDTLGHERPRVGKRGDALDRSSMPTKRSVGRAGNGAGGRPVNAPRSM